MNFQFSSLINAPVEVVWAFHERPDILDILTPPWQPVQVVRREGGLGPGALTEFRLWLGPIPLTWLAQHTEAYEIYRQFTDIQVTGPLAAWTHRHCFTPAGPQTRLSDDISFELPAAWLSEPMLGDFIYQRLEDMFRYRHQTTQSYCAALLRDD